MIPANRFVEAFVLSALLLCATPLCLAALTLRGAPEATVQVTCPYCFLPVPVTVQALDKHGRPKEHVEVTFSAPAANAFIPGGGEGPYTVRTDENGYASAPAPGFVTISRDTRFDIIASAHESNSELFAITVEGTPPARLLTSEQEPVALIGTQYPERTFWAIALDETDNLMPNAVVVFALAGNRTQPSGTFGNGSRISLASGANDSGFAFAPALLANLVAGKGSIRASTLNPQMEPASMDFYNSGRVAASMEPIPGSTPQSTRQNAVFPQPIGVIVRDEAGLPQEGVAVHFSFVLRRPPSPSGSFLSAETFLEELSAMSDENGRAVARLPAVSAGSAGTLQLQGSTPGAGVLFVLNITPGAASGAEIVSGDGQRALVNTSYAEPWVWRALGRDGLPVPYAIMSVQVPNNPDQPGASLGVVNATGFQNVLLFADVNGILTSPVPVANGVPGRGFAQAMTFGGGGFLPIGFENVAAP